jgi:type II secretory pathway component PulC
MALLVLLCLALGAGLSAEVTQPIISARSPVSASHGDPNTRPDPTFIMPPLNTYAEVATRPLFSRTRRAPVVVAPGQLSEFKLVATVISAQDSHALLTHGSPPKIERIAQNQIFEGWFVKSIEPNRVVLERDGNVTEIGYSAIKTAAGEQPPTEVSTGPIALPHVMDNPSAGMFRYQIPNPPILNGGD